MTATRLIVSAGALLLPSLLPAQATWLQAKVLNGRSGAAWVYDSARSRAVLFGGHAEPDVGALAETWEWNGASWSLRTPVTSPPGRVGHALAYDAQRGRVVLFGGNAPAFAYHSDTWEWDGDAWSNQTPGNAPTPRAGHAMVYDTARGRVVLFGGQTSSGPVGDTWEWDGTAWSQRLVAGPPARYFHALAYDAARGRVVLFGGVVQGQSSNDTWEWDGNTWTQRSSRTSPAPRVSGTMSYHASRGRVTLFGGWASNQEFVDTWEWNGTDWVERLPTNNPAVRPGAVLVYDAARDRSLLFSGEAATLWEWNGTDWQLRQASCPSHYEGVMTYDWNRRRVVLLALSDDQFDRFATWEWDGASWTLRKPVTSPPYRFGTAAVYDVARARVVLFGGYARGVRGDTWEWDGVNWSLRSPATSPPARNAHAMVYDIARARTVLFGGTNGDTGAGYNDTWEWDGIDWSLATTVTSPPVRCSHCMAYDIRRGRTILFGGVAADAMNQPVYAKHTWEYDGTTWKRSKSAHTPPVRVAAAMAYDLARGRTVMFGGLDDSGYSRGFDDTWEWDGTDWSVVTTLAQPPAYGYRSMAYDIDQGHMVLPCFGRLWLHGRANLPAATSLTLGTACAGSRGAPTLTSTLPLLGGTGFSVDLLSARVSSPCAFGFAPQAQALNLGGGCSLYLAGPIFSISATSTAAGFASTGFALPNDPVLRGGVLYAQGVVLDPLGAFAGLALTRGLKLTLGY